jgi:hypothetical protein
MDDREAISSRTLRSSDLPSRNARWLTIAQFALTFDGYAHWGSFKRCAAIAKQRRLRTLNELRTCLFFEQRRWHHLAINPNPKSMRYIRGLIEELRIRLRRREAKRR